MRYDVLAIALLFLIGLIWLYRRDHRRALALRARIFRPCRKLLEAPENGQDRAGFPYLKGQYHGSPVCLESLIEAVSVRKLPQLLVKVTLYGQVATEGTLDVMMRPLNVEFYSPANDLPHALARPSGWPEHAVLRSDLPKLPVPLHSLERVTALFEDPQVKELLITPRGLRIVYRLSEAERSSYLVLRQAQFRTNQADPDKVAELLDSLRTLRAEIAATQRKQPASPQRLSA